MKAGIVFAVGLVFGAFAGCVNDATEEAEALARRAGRAVGGATEPVFPPDWFELALPFGPGHDHLAVEHHLNLTTANFETLGFEPLITDYYGKTAGDYFCGDAKEKDGRRLSVVHSWGSDVAFVIADVTDPTQPEKIGELAMANTQVYDIALTPDFNYVVLSTSPFDSGPDSPELPPFVWGEFFDECSGATRPVMGPEAGLPFSSGAVLVDIRNPRNPTVVDFRQLPVIGSHSVRANDVDGRTIVTVSVDNAVSTVSYYVFFDILETAAGGKLVPISVYSYVPESADRAAPSFGVHMDGYIAKHPGNGKNYAWLAYRGTGFIIVDMSNPSMPQFVARWNPFPVTIHSVLPMAETWEDKHYTILGEECGGPGRGNPSCLIFIVDTTDPANPQLAGAWTLPAEVEWSSGLQFSMHYYDVVGRTLFVSTYHGGLWAVDLSTPEKIRTAPTIGVYIPDQESPKPVGSPPRSLAGRVLFNVVANTNIDWHPTVIDLVAFPDGMIVLWDAQGGLYTARFNETQPAPAALPQVKGIGLG